MLNSQNYGNQVTLTSTGSVVPALYNADGIVGNTAGDHVVNHGTVEGAKAAYNNGNGGNGGVGIDLTAPGNIVNSGEIKGGAGTYAHYRVISDGGNGVSMAGGHISNGGFIYGGDRGGSNQGRVASAGGAGVYGAIDPVTLNNFGHIYGGGGGNYGQGGAGVDLTAGGTIHNNGFISGAYSYYGRGGAGVDFGAPSVLVNTGLIRGGGQSVGIDATGSRISNSGNILGGVGAYPGGAALSLTGGVLNNTGHIQGGSGGVSDHYQASPAGAGVIADGTTIANGGTIYGGSADGSSYGGAGVVLSGAGRLTNNGTISGGGAQYSVYGSRMAGAGVGVSLAPGARGSSTGLIQGGSSGSDEGRFALAGGAGLSLGAGSTFNNTGIIAGGAGSYGANYAGSGGDGADINGATLTTSGTIAAGSGGASPGQPGAPGDAVSFGSAAGTLIIDPGAVFEGNIVGSNAADDTIVLAGSASGTLAGFGTAITDITTIKENAGGTWTLQGSIGGQGSIEIGKDASLTLTGGAVTIPSVVFANGGDETLVLGSPAGFTATLSGFGSGDQIDLVGVKANALNYANGTLTLFGAGHSTVATLTFTGNYSTADFTLEEQHGTAELFYAGSPALHVQDFLPSGVVPNTRLIQVERPEATLATTWHVNGSIAEWHVWSSVHV